ncbi:hypothetical protein J3R82DRAFT_9541 [Butyriboletus roseoflavus]|nr:hypothetical protein J3R82DRAFT_9541 [Butyriboletus roseoflavus]
MGFVVIVTQRTVRNVDISERMNRGRVEIPPSFECVYHEYPNSTVPHFSALWVHIKHREAAHPNTTKCRPHTILDIPSRQGTTWGSNRPSRALHAYLLPSTGRIVSYHRGWRCQASTCDVGHDAINNAITWMSSGFSNPLYLVGVGYRAALEDDPEGTVACGNGKGLNHKFGHSHNIFVIIPAHITAEALRCLRPPRLWLVARTPSLWATLLPKFEDYVPLSHTREK